MEINIELQTSTKFVFIEFQSGWKILKPKSFFDWILKQFTVAKWNFYVSHEEKRTQNRLLISRYVFFFLAVVKIHCLNWTISKSILMLRFCCINRAVRSSALHQIENLISTIWNLSIFELHISFIYLFSASFLSRSGLFFLKRHDYMTASDMAYYSILRCALSTS